LVDFWNLPRSPISDNSSNLIKMHFLCIYFRD
jgi:hypothetical protein